MQITREGQAAPRQGAADATATESGRRPNITLPGRRPAIITLLVLLVLAAGCANIQVTDRTVPQSSTANQRATTIADVPNTQETRDLAIAALDFDPALNSQSLAVGRPYSLLVAVENKGNRREGPITVTAQLNTHDGQEILLSAERTVPRLSAGDVTVVRFPGNVVPPAYRSYVLNVQVQPLAAETSTGNNKRTLEIQVNAGGN